MDGLVLGSAAKWLTPERITGKQIVDVGSYNVNGSLHSIVDPLKPAGYLGIDIEPGPDVDVVMDGANLFKAYGQIFDVCLCASCLEHCKDWKAVWLSMVQALKTGGWFFVSVPAADFPYHDYRGDYWRFNPAILRKACNVSGIDVLSCDFDESGHNVHLFGFKTDAAFSPEQMPEAMALVQGQPVIDTGDVPAWIKLDIGCGAHFKEPLDEWTHLDMVRREHVELVGDFGTIALPNNSVKAIHIGDVIEHVPPWRVKEVLTEWNRVAALGCTLTGATPNIERILMDYHKGEFGIDIALLNMYGWNTNPYEHHYVTYSPTSLKAMFETYGFEIDTSGSPGPADYPWWIVFTGKKVKDVH